MEGKTDLVGIFSPFHLFACIGVFIVVTFGLCSLTYSWVYIVFLMVLLSDNWNVWVLFWLFCFFIGFVFLVSVVRRWCQNAEEERFSALLWLNIKYCFSLRVTCIEFFVWCLTFCPFEFLLGHTSRKTFNAYNKMSQSTVCVFMCLLFVTISELFLFI